MPRHGLPFQEPALLSQNDVTTGKLLVFVDATAQWCAADVERDLEHLSALTLTPKADHDEPDSEAPPRVAELSPRCPSEGSTVDEHDDECGNGIDATTLNDTNPHKSRALTMFEDNETKF
ncbi:hypothetical protein SDRG_00055 [Saprolegnia diclina VS20]|uniref:Uncharacterized protein n=1 Tax=Saprolegnia diclina (strain VS20) TaxID=1156394 RepID=T0R5V1_SAPDV|nr:hypothetical protein SDRG_00055 [Saprolegnia diclina VS20]EQC42316.1 hypothetical protein SDRG_00055 [Saprolegnia diclina VS20]|eukprot:XP_008603739.1 hypothetical protein SDRG_00055 [Saprolegnia diclina VS20]